MTDTPPNAAPPAAPTIDASRSRGRSWFSTLLLIFLMLLTFAALGYGAWRYQRYRSETQETMESQDALLRRLGRQQGLDQSQINDLNAHVADLTQSARGAADDIAGLRSRLDESQAALAKLDETVQGGRRRLQLLGVEQLLLIASDRAQLVGDLRGAVMAMSLAQERLGAIADPRLFEVRKALADERAALAAVASPDLAGVSLTLGGLLGRLATLPLKSELPEHYDPQAHDATPPGGTDRASQHLWHTLQAGASALFTVRRIDLPQERLFSVEQQGLIGHLLALKLENARAALWAGHAEAYRESLTEAAGWLTQYYRAQDPGVLATQAELERLKALDPHPPLPELGRSLGLLRAYLDAQPQ